jgi:transcriptional regulator NrdR family protein
MQCPICQTKLKTTNSRETAGGTLTWRRKHCPACEITLTSKESLDLSGLIKIDGISYSKAKLTAKLAKLSSKSSEDDLADTVETIERRLLKLSRHSHPITNQILTSEIMTVLEKLDKGAYLRYKAEVEES